jgi:hypothetical protein
MIVGAVEGYGKQSACNLFGRAVASSIPAVHTFKKSLILHTNFVLLHAMPFESSLHFMHKRLKNGHSLALINKKCSFTEDGFLPP